MLKEKKSLLLSIYLYPENICRHRNMHSRGSNPCFCSHTLGAQPSQGEDWKNEFCPYPPFNSSAHPQAQDLILTFAPGALTGSLQIHTKDSVLASDAGLNQELTSSSWPALWMRVCMCEYEVCDGCTLMGSQPYCLGITPFSSWVTVGSHSQSQSTHSSRIHWSFLLWQAFWLHRRKPGLSARCTQCTLQNATRRLSLKSWESF